MILPTKHTHFSESLLGFGAYLLPKINPVRTIDSLWNEYQKEFHEKTYSVKHSFDNLLLTLLFLHSIGVVEERDGEVYKCC